MDKVIDIEIDEISEEKLVEIIKMAAVAERTFTNSMQFLFPDLPAPGQFRDLPESMQDIWINVVLNVIMKMSEFARDKEQKKANSN